MQKSNKIEGIYLCGSRLGGWYRDNSDIDIAIDILCDNNNIRSTSFVENSMIYDIKFYLKEESVKGNLWKNKYQLGMWSLFENKLINYNSESILEYLKNEKDIKVYGEVKDYVEKRKICNWATRNFEIIKKNVLKYLDIWSTCKTKKERLLIRGYTMEDINNKEILKWSTKERKDLLDFIKNNIGDAEYNDIYLGGSRCIGWNRDDSDFDILIEMDISKIQLKEFKKRRKTKNIKYKGKIMTIWFLYEEKLMGRKDRYQALPIYSLINNKLEIGSKTYTLSFLQKRNKKINRILEDNKLPKEKLEKHKDRIIEKNVMKKIESYYDQFGEDFSIIDI